MDGYSPLAPTISDPDFTWGKLSGREFCDQISEAYEEVVHWKRNVFMIPSGNAGKKFVNQLASLFQAYADQSTLECIAMKAAVVMQVVLLQKPAAKSKARDHAAHLDRRLSMWINGDIEPLLSECRCLQNRLAKNNEPNDEEVISRNFSKMMMMGKVNSALRYLSQKTSGGVLGLDDLIPVKDGSSPRTVRDILHDLHPAAKDPVEESLLKDTPSNSLPFDPILFESLDGSRIRDSALRCRGSAGPSGLDSLAWRRMCCSFKQASAELCTALAGVCRRICIEPVHPDGLSALVACRLIALNKCPGVRPIGVGEVPRRIMAKAVMSIVRDDVLKAAGPLQVCAGQNGGCEAAVHAMREIFANTDTHGVLLVDATNAFNSLHRKTAIHNMKFICPALAIVLANTYQSPVRMFISGGEVLSCEGTTQGDPLSMAMYALAITPLIRRLNELQEDVSQVWFADDATAAASCHNLRSWWDQLSAIGPQYGYHPNASKTFLVVKDDYEDEAKTVFGDTNISVTTRGKRHLGAAVGSRDFTTEYVSRKVEEWCDELMSLAKIAESQPHAAFAAFNHGMTSKWTYVCRTIPEIDDLLRPLDEVIHQHFIPAITGHPPCSPLERQLLALPPRLGGLGLSNPSSDSQSEFESSKQVTGSLVALIVVQDLNGSVTDEPKRTKASIRKAKREKQLADAHEVRQQLTQQQKRLMECATEKGASAWVTTLPIDDHGFFLHKGDFRDALCLRYGWPVSGLPQKCCCGSVFSIDHAMTCHKGGYPSIRHNEIRDVSANLLSEICHNTCVEPVLQPLSGESFQSRSANTQDDARCDIRARGFWSRGQDAFFDVRVFHPNASSYRNKDLASLYKLHENAKKREYGERVREVEHAVFTPLVLSTCGGMSHETTTFYKKLAADLATKRKLQYSEVLGWLRCRISFALLRSAIMAIRGSRSSSHSGAPADILLASREGNAPRL